jgi:AraC-like DNA-binding protein
MIVVFDVDDEYLRRTVAYAGKKDARVIITNNQNEVIYSTDGSISFNEVFAPVSDFPASGYSQARLGGEERLVIRYVLEKYDWNYYLTIPVSAVNSGSEMIIVWEIILCVFMAAVCYYLSYMLSSRFYRPIKSISDMISAADYNSGGDNEIQLIQNKVLSLIADNRSLTNALEAHMAQQKEIFLKSVIDGECGGYDASLSRLRRYSLDIGADDSYIAYYVAMNNYPDFLSGVSENEKNIAALYLNNLITEFVAGYGHGFAADLGLARVAVVLSCARVYSEGLKAEFYNVARKLSELTGSGMNQLFTIGVSLIHKGFHNIPQCFEEAKNALYFRLIYEDARIIFYENAALNNAGTVEYPFSIEKEILLAIKLGKRDRLPESLDAFSAYFKTNIAHEISAVRSYYIQLFSTSLHCVYDIDRNFDLRGFAYESMYTLLNKQETLSEMNDCMAKFYNYIFDTMEREQNVRARQFVEDIKAYIGENLSADMSTELLSRRFFISESYLRRMFKEEANTNIKKYIDERRMDKAKQLLAQDPNMQITQIALEIGYLSVQAFTTAFKASTGLTPTAYRRQLYKNMN